MTEKSTHHNLQELLDEIQRTDGLPQNFSTEAQLWDEILKKEAYLMPEQLFPLIKEVHGKSYPLGTPINPLATEYSVERAGTKAITDHFSLTFPHSAVLYLQCSKNTPDKLSCQIQFQDGSIYSYHIPVIKVQAYSLDEIQEKNLYVLIPFLPLRFRPNLRIYEKNSRNSNQNCFLFSTKEELTSFYQRLILILEEGVNVGYLTEANRTTILSLLGKSMIRVFCRNEELLKEVLHMTEPILELEFEKYWKIIDQQKTTIEEKEAKIQELEQQLAALTKS